MDELSREEDRYLSEQLFAYNRALMANSGLSDESFKHVQKQSRESCLELVNLVRPWEDQNVAAMKAKEHTELREVFKTLVGDPDDPAWQAEQKRQLELWNQELAARTEQPDPMQLLMERQEARLSRLRELDEQRKRMRRTIHG